MNDIPDLFPGDNPAPAQNPAPAKRQLLRDAKGKLLSHGPPRPEPAWTDADFMDGNDPHPLPRIARNFPAPIQTALKAYLYGKRKDGLRHGIASAARVGGIAVNTLKARAAIAGLQSYRLALDRRLIDGSRVADAGESSLVREGRANLETLRSRHKATIEAISALPPTSKHLKSLLSTEQSLFRSILAQEKALSTPAARPKAPKADAKPIPAPTTAAQAPQGDTVTLPDWD